MDTVPICRARSIDPVYDQIVVVGPLYCPIRFPPFSDKFDDCRIMLLELRLPIHFPAFSTDTSHDFDDVSIFFQHLPIIFQHLPIFPAFSHDFPRHLPIFPPSSHHFPTIFPDICPSLVTWPPRPQNESSQWPGRWIGLRENLSRKPMGFYHQIDRFFRLKFSHHPIL